MIILISSVVMSLMSKENVMHVFGLILCSLSNYSLDVYKILKI